MRRRSVVAAAAALAPAALRVAAQPARALLRIALLAHNLPLADMAGPQAEAGVRALLDALRALGHVEGRNLLVERRSAEGRPERVPEMVREVVALRPDVIVTFSPVVFQAAQHATTTIAIVAVGGGGQAMAQANLARPGANFTGLVTDAGFGALNGKRLELLKEAAPGATRVAVIRPPAPAGQPLLTAQLEQAARALGLSLSVAIAGGPDDFDAAFAAIVRDRADAMLCVATPTNLGSRQRIVDFAARERLPAAYGRRDFVDAGGLMSYGIHFVELSRQAAAYVDKILRGARPGDLPIQQPTRFELALNRRAARQLGITIPRSLLLRADEVLE